MKQRNSVVVITVESDTAQRSAPSRVHYTTESSRYGPEHGLGEGGGEDSVDFENNCYLKIKA